MNEPVDVIDILVLRHVWRYFGSRLLKCDIQASQLVFSIHRHLANLCAQGDDGAFDDALRMFVVNSVKNPKANLWN